jgi:hypothetical protein
MNKDKLKELVNALDELSDDVKDWEVDINSDVKPMCDTPGCHAGLISIVAKDLPELQEIYERIFFSHWNLKYSHYEYSIWADTLAEFLGLSNYAYQSCVTAWGVACWLVRAQHSNTPVFNIITQ